MIRYSVRNQYIGKGVIDQDENGGFVRFNDVRKLLADNALLVETLKMTLESAKDEYACGEDFIETVERSIKQAGHD